jgi:SAM-dependent methyltransferase
MVAQAAAPPPPPSTAEATLFDGEEFRIGTSMLRQPSPGKVRRQRVALVGVAVVAVISGYLWALVAAAGALLVFIVAVVPVVFLVVGKRLSSAGAGLVIPAAMRSVDVKYGAIRAELLKSIHGRVLDVGAGGGAYLKYAFASSAVTDIVALEPNVACHSALHATVAELRRGEGFGRGLSAPPVGLGLAAASTTRDTANRGPTVEIVSEFIEDHLKRVGPGCYDWAILGNVLCEVPDQVSVLTALDGLLKPGGRIYFCEHVRVEPGTFIGWLQDFVNPWWCVLSDGCNCNRDSVATMCKVTPWTVKPWTFNEAGLPWIPRFVLGMAVKPK